MTFKLFLKIRHKITENTQHTGPDISKQIVKNQILHKLRLTGICSVYRNFPKFSDRQVWANSVDPDQTAPSSLIRVYTVCHSVCIVWTHYSMKEPHSSNFRVITTNVLGVRIFTKFTVYCFCNLKPVFCQVYYSILIIWTTPLFI